MNHYPHHIGDYLKDTAHLDPTEDGIYRRMLDLYYTLEGPLEANTTFLCRRLRLDVRKYGSVVNVLLAEFFTLNDQETHWHHNRCDQEIAKYQEKAAANRKNGKAGGRPRRTQEKPTNNPDGYQLGSQTVTQNNLNQNQNQNQVKALSGKPDCDRATKKKEAEQLLAFLNEKTGAAYRPVDTNLSLITARLNAGVSPEDVRRVIESKCAQWLGDPKMEEYLRPKTLFCPSNFENYLGGVGSRPRSEPDL